MKPRAFKFIFFITIIILIIISIFIIYINKHEKVLEAKFKKIDSVISNNISIGLVNYDNLNPHISQNQDIQYISKLIYKDLIGINEKFELVSSLASEWSKIADNTYLIKLYENQYWHNGKKFTSRDVEFTINELKKEKSTSIYKENVQNIEKIELIDDYTIKVYTKKNDPFFEYNLCLPILPCDFEGKNIGTGQYRVRESTDKYIVLEEKDKGDLSKKIKINIYNSYGELYSAFSKGKIDIITTSNIEFNNYVGTIGLKEEKIIGRDLTYLKINTSEVSNIKKAINCAIDKNEIIYNIFNNKYFCADNPLDNRNYFGQVSDKDGYNLNNAKKYIANSGWRYNNEVWIKNGSILNMNLSIKQNNENDIKVAQELKTQLEKIGIRINIVELSDDSYNLKLKDNDYQIILCNDTLPIFPEIEKYLNTENVHVRELLNKIENIENKDILKETYNEIIKQYREENSIICLYFDSIIILHNSHVKGDFTGNWYNIFYNIDTWYKEL